MSFEQALQTVVSDLGWIVGFVLWTVLILSVAQLTNSSNQSMSPTSTFHESNRVYESQMKILREPDETRGIAIRETEFGPELLRIAEKDGDYYETTHFTVYNQDLESVANELSYQACEREREIEND